MTAPRGKQNYDELFEKWLSPEAVTNARPLSDGEIQVMRRQLHSSVAFGHLVDSDGFSKTLEHLFNVLNLRPGDAVFTNRVRRELRQWQGIMEELSQRCFVPPSDTAH